MLFSRFMETNTTQMNPPRKRRMSMRSTRIPSTRRRRILKTRRTPTPTQTILASRCIEFVLRTTVDGQLGGNIFVFKSRDANFSLQRSEGVATVLRPPPFWDIC